MRENQLYDSSGRTGLEGIKPSAKCLWLLDEPNSGLDSAGQKAFEAVLATHQEAGGLSVLASHHSLDSRLKPRYLDLSIKE